MLTPHRSAGTTQGWQQRSRTGIRRRDMGAIMLIEDYGVTRELGRDGFASRYSTAGTDDGLAAT